MKTHYYHLRHLRRFRNSTGSWVSKGVANGLWSIFVGVVAHLPAVVATGVMLLIPQKSRLGFMMVFASPVLLAWIGFGLVCLVGQALLAGQIVRVHRHGTRPSSDQVLGAWGLWTLGVLLVFAPVILMIIPR